MLPQEAAPVLRQDSSEYDPMDAFLEEMYTPEERYQQAQSEIRREAREAKREANAKRNARRKQEPSASVGQSGVKPPLPPLETQNKFGILEEVKSPVSYADYMKQAPPRPLRREFPPLRVEADPFSPVPGSKKALVSKKP